MYFERNQHLASFAGERVAEDRRDSRHVSR